jgi:hypothetical protein
MGNLMEAQKTNLIKENKCFYCQKAGHHANVCYKKKHDKGETTAAFQVNAVDTDNNQMEATKTVHGIIGKITDEEKLKLVEDLLPKDFLQGCHGQATMSFIHLFVCAGPSGPLTVRVDAKLLGSI